ncbi:hypothetical protein FQA39_LY08424 [Lamprigera yunnana]|nr:hypothetical protein FQA39_LY08424 [Lamprigera yunnana]
MIAPYNTPSASISSSEEQDEWKEFEEEKKDYTGLKIGNLTINSPVDNTNNAENVTEQQREDSNIEIDRKAGPWKKLDSDVAEPEVEKKVEPVPAPSTVAQPTSSIYVPPVLRNSHQQQQQQMSFKVQRSKVAPDIRNEDNFPSLTSTKADLRRNRNEGSFEMVAPNKASSYRQAEQNKYSNQGPKLSLGNRYNTLSNDS